MLNNTDKAYNPVFAELYALFAFYINLLFFIQINDEETFRTHTNRRHGRIFELKFPMTRQNSAVILDVFQGILTPSAGILAE